MQVKLGSNFIKVKINQYPMSVIRPPQTVPPPVNPVTIAIVETNSIEKIF